MSSGGAAGAPGAALTEEEESIQRWKVKRLVKKLSEARGNGTSMISLVIRPTDQIAKISKMLADEYGTASNIKSRVNRLSVLSAITSTQQRLKLYGNKVPTNGLVIYCGTVINEDGKEKKVNISLSPFKPINTSLYLCDNKFHTECLSELLHDTQTFGFLVMDGNGSLFGTVSGNTREVLHKISVDLPKKHGRGGQSALRFARLRLEKRHNYLRKVAELCVQFFISDDKPNVAGLVLAGLAEFKNELERSDLFDSRLKDIVLKIVDVSYGGEAGFNQAIELSAECLSNVKLVQEKRLIGSFFEEIAKDTGKFCYGVRDTMQGLELGAVSTLIMWENLDVARVTVRNKETEAESVLYLTPAQLEKSEEHFKDKATGAELEIIDNQVLTEWLAEHYKQYGCVLEFVTDRSEEGSQFCKGFGGLGGLLRYRVDFTQMHEEEYDDEIDSDDFSENDFI